MLTARNKSGCSTLPCSFGRTTLWLDKWEPGTSTWLLTNLAATYGRNSEAHGWSTWLYGMRGLFNVMIKLDNESWGTTQAENIPQIWSVSIATNGTPTTAEFAYNQLHDGNCLTGRVSAAPNVSANACFDGQKISFVRRCYSGETVVSFWNNTVSDGTGTKCVSTYPNGFNVPILRTYVTELDANCVPKKSWASSGISPARAPLTLTINRQMGAVAEWGDMLSAISPDGNYLAMATNMGPPGNTNLCAGFSYVLNDVNVSNSGQAARITHWCPLSKNVTTGQITCGTVTALAPGGYDPPESTPVPSFYKMSGSMTVLFSRNWAQYQTTKVLNIMQNNLGTGYQQMFFGTTGANLYAIQAINY